MSPTDTSRPTAGSGHAAGRLPVFRREAAVISARPSNDTDRALLAAAKNQHALARGIAPTATASQSPPGEIATKVAMSPDHLRKILRGKAHVFLTDLHRIADAVGSRIIATIIVGRTPADRDSTQPV